MKRIRCPKCDNLITFDETAYEPGRVLIFECSDCNKQFKIKIPEKKLNIEEEEQEAAPAHLTVIENAFHFKQILPLFLGENTLGRYVKGNKANSPIKTVDPSVDTTHCVITAKISKNEEWTFLLSDAKSNTGTFYMDHILGPKEQVRLDDGDIITIGATTMIFHLNEEEAE
jgi:hypothetical protein